MLYPGKHGLAGAAQAAGMTVEAKKKKKDGDDGSEVKAKTHRPAKTASFGATSKREMRHEIMGEGSPGPGSYMPASSFARAASASRVRSKSGKPAPSSLSSFRSTSLQRPRAQNERVPGPGNYSPTMGSIEKNLTNPGALMSSKSERGKLWDASESGKLGPGEYNSHFHRSLNEAVSRSVSKTSRANPGFGSRSSRKLPHESAIEDNEKWYRNMSAEAIRRMVCGKTPVSNHPPACAS